MLRNDFEGKTTIYLFFVDKDVDDLRQLIRPSKHLIYTQFYHFENYIFREGDLVERLASAASVEVATCKHVLSDLESWRYQSASKWKDWVKICLLTQKLNIRGEANYSKESQIHTDKFGPVDLGLLKEYLEKLKIKSGLTDKQFRAAYKSSSKTVDDLYSRMDYDLVFKGKWYAKFLEHDMKTISFNRPYQHNGLAERLTSTTQTTLDFSGDWTNYFKKTMINLVDRF